MHKTVVLIILAAVVALIVIVVLTGMRYLRADDEDSFDDETASDRRQPRGRGDHPSRDHFRSRHHDDDRRGEPGRERGDRDGSFRGAAGRAGRDRDAAVRDGASRAGRDSASRTGAGRPDRESTGRESTGRESTGRDSTGRDSAGRAGAGRSGLADSFGRRGPGRDDVVGAEPGRKSASRDSASRDSASRDSASRDSASRDAAGRAAASRDSASWDSTGRGGERRGVTAASREAAGRSAGGRDPVPGPRGGARDSSARDSGSARDSSPGRSSDRGWDGTSQPGRDERDSRNSGSHRDPRRAGTRDYADADSADDLISASPKSGRGATGRGSQRDELDDRPGRGSGASREYLRSGPPGSAVPEGRPAEGRGTDGRSQESRTAAGGRDDRRGNSGQNARPDSRRAAAAQGKRDESLPDVRPRQGKGKRDADGEWPSTEWDEPLTLTTGLSWPRTSRSPRPSCSRSRRLCGLTGHQMPTRDRPALPGVMPQNGVTGVTRPIGATPPSAWQPSAQCPNAQCPSAQCPSARPCPSAEIKAGVSRASCPPPRGGRP